MKILITKGYGDIRVYDVDTVEKFKKNISDIIVCLDGWGLDDTIERVEKFLDNENISWADTNRAFNTLKDAINPGYDNDTFEDLFVTDLG